MSHTWLSKGLDVYMNIHTPMKQAQAFRNVSHINTQKILLTVYTYSIHENWVFVFGTRLSPSHKRICLVLRINEESTLFTYVHACIREAGTCIPSCLTREYTKSPTQICICIYMCVYVNAYIREAGMWNPPCPTHEWARNLTYICTCIRTWKQAYVFRHVSHIHMLRALLTYVHAKIYVYVYTYIRANHIRTCIHTWRRHMCSAMPHTWMRKEINTYMYM